MHVFIDKLALLCGYFNLQPQAGADLGPGQPGPWPWVQPNFRPTICEKNIWPRRSPGLAQVVDSPRSISSRPLALIQLLSCAEPGGARGRCHAHTVYLH